MIKDGRATAANTLASTKMVVSARSYYDSENIDYFKSFPSVITPNKSLKVFIDTKISIVDAIHWSHDLGFN